jgi:hypothetical protein
VAALCFAGEHTSLDWQRYTNGEAKSGRRAADALLGPFGRGDGDQTRIDSEFNQNLGHVEAHIKASEREVATEVVVPAVPFV